MKKISIILALTPALVFAHNVPNNIKIIPLENMEFPSSLKAEMKAYNNSIKNSEFIQSENLYPRNLLRMRNHTLKFSNSDDPSERELKKSISEISLTFTYKSKIPNSFAYAGIGIVSSKGFSGIKEFFDGKELGMCTSSTFSRAGVTAPIQLNQDGLKYDVNDKPTRISIEGSYNSGFLYSVRWYDKNFVRDIECANLKYDKTIAHKIIILANKIDKE